MKTTVQALQDVYIQLGGALTDTYAGIAGGVPVGDYTAIPDMVEAVSKKASAGGGGSGGDSICILHATIDGQTVSFSETASDVVDAYKAGKIMIVVDQDGKVYYESNGSYTEGETYDYLELNFHYNVREGRNFVEYAITVYWDNDGEGTFDLSIYVNTVYGIPQYSASDSGKVLTINSTGTPVWTTPT